MQQRQKTIDQRQLHTVFGLVALFALVLSLSCVPKGVDHASHKGAKTIKLTQIRFDDGDTFYLDNKPIRVLGVDTPEVAHPELGFEKDQPFGVVASESTQVWLQRAKRIELIKGARDKYNRRLAHVFLDGELLSIRLIRHALAYETVSHYGDSGFPDLAQQILDVSRKSPKPQFQPPYRWKKKNRKPRK